MIKRRESRLLIVDDDKSVVEYLVETFQEDGYNATGITCPLEALELLKKENYALVIADIEMPKLRGLDLMNAIHKYKSDQLILLITAFGSIDIAVKSLRAGACDFVTKPFRFEVLQVAVERALRERQMRREIVRLRASLPEVGSSTGLIARSPAMKSVVELATRAARTEVNVLLSGESGVGKGEVARFIHNRSDRSARKFVRFNCAAFPPSLIESELFGLGRSVSNETHEDNRGVFVKADGGTLFIEEITEMPLETQTKLLQVIESRTVHPIGDSVEVPVDVRLLVSTNQPLEEALEQRQFRRDLYYRLNVIHIRVAPLRERPEDLLLFIETLLERACTQVGRPILGISAEALRWMLAWTWPGNVRELANVIERAVVLSEHDTIVLDDVRLPLSSDDAGGDFLDYAAQQGKSLEEVENAYIQKILKVTQGNKAEAARILRIDRSTLYRRLGEEV